MQRFLEDISSVHFWLAVVLVGVIINIGSEYLKRAIDHYWKTQSAKRLARVKEASQEREKRLAALRESTSEQLIAMQYVAQDRVMGAVGLVCSQILLTLRLVLAQDFPPIPDPVVQTLLVATPLAGAAILFQASMRAFQRGRELEAVVQDAREVK